MRNGFVFRLTLAIALGLIFVPALHASPLRDPKRLLNGQSVNLHPLFQWWTNHSGSRPLTAWVHITGRPVGTNAWGWIIDARVERTERPGHSSGGAAKLMLRNPPTQDRAEFERLSGQLKTLEQQRSAVASQESAAQNRATTVAQEQNTYRKYGLRNRNLAAEDRALKHTEAEAKAELKPLDQQIQDLKKQLAVYPNPDHYELDCFALETGQEFERLPLYDHGSALK